jgi:hypothetical protein
VATLARRLAVCVLALLALQTVSNLLTPLIAPLIVAAVLIGIYVVLIHGPRSFK